MTLHSCSHCGKSGATHCCLYTNCDNRYCSIEHALADTAHIKDHEFKKDPGIFDEQLRAESVLLPKT